MVADSTRDLVLQVVDSNIEFGAKIFVLIILLLYACFSIWFSYKMYPSGSRPQEVPIHRYIGAMGLRVFAFPILFFFLMFSFWLYRGIAFENFINLIFVFYGMAFTILLLYFIFFGVQIIYDMFGFNFKNFSRRKNFKRRFRMRRN